MGIGDDQLHAGEALTKKAFEEKDQNGSASLGPMCNQGKRGADGHTPDTGPGRCIARTATHAKSGKRGQGCTVHLTAASCDHESAAGLELRIDVGPGYRVYYAQAGKTVMLLLCGGAKQTQDADIDRVCAC